MMEFFVVVKCVSGGLIGDIGVLYREEDPSEESLAGLSGEGNEHQDEERS